MIENELRKLACSRLEKMEGMFEMDSKVLREFKKTGRIYCSYPVIWGGDALELITNDHRYAQAIRDFEEKSKCLVFHAVEAYWEHGTLLALLYAAHKEEGDLTWEDYEEKQVVPAYVVNLEYPSHSEFGDIVICGRNGALHRTH